MSMISEQVKKLRTEAECYENTGLFAILSEAADTIESLYEKLRAQVTCDGEWIYCADRFNLPNKSGAYRTVFNGEEVFAELNFDTSDGTWYSDNGQYQEVIAWWKKAYEL